MFNELKGRELSPLSGPKKMEINDKLFIYGQEEAEDETEKIPEEDATEEEDDTEDDIDDEDDETF